MSKKTILILCFLGDPTLAAGSLLGTGGYNASVNDLMKLLINDGTYNCIFVTNTTGNYTEPSTIQISSNVTLYRIFAPSNHLLHKNNYIHEIENFVKEIEKIIKNVDNISFIHSFYWLSGLVATLFSEKYQIPFIHTTVSLSKQKELAGCPPAIKHQFDYENIFLHKAKYILAITEEEERILIEYYKIEAEKIIVEGQNIASDYHYPIYDSYGIPQSFIQSNAPLKPIGFDELNISKGTWWNYGAFTYVGRIAQNKGVDIIIKAWVELDKRFNGAIPPLWLVGNTPYEIDKFRAKLDVPLDIINEYEKTKRIVWWGYLTPAAISTIYLKTSVLVTHSAFEGGGRVILEALCQGIPVISTNTGFGKDYIKNWMNGFIINYGDIETLIFRMSHFVLNPILSSVLGENGKNYFLEMEKNWNRECRIKDLYNAIIDNKKYINSYSFKSIYIDNYFKKGIVTTYPYFYHKPSLENIINYTVACTNEKVISSFYKQLYPFDIWKYNNKYVIKYIYPKLNKRKIWDCSESQNVWNTYEILEKITYISRSPVILTPINISPKKLLIMFPCIKMLNNEDIQKYIYKIAANLKSLSKISVFDEKKGISLVAYWENLQRCITLLNNKKLKSQLRKMPSLINSFMTNPTNFTRNFCIQYAQSPLGHVGLFNNKILFLPTYRWKYTQEGLDGGMLLFYILTQKDYLLESETLIILDYLSKIWNIPKTQILGWSLCICIENMINDVVFNNSKVFEINKAFSHLSNVLYKLILS